MTIPSKILLRNGLLATYAHKDAPTSIPSASRVDIIVEGDRIAAIAEPNSIQAEDGVSVVDCTHKWISPGFVDTHRHLWMSVVDDHDDLTLAEYLAKMSWTTAALVDADAVYVGELAGCLQALNGGTTTVVDHFHCANSPGHIEKAIDAAAQSGLRCMLCVSRQSLPTNIQPLEFGDDDEYSKMQVELLSALAKRDNGRLTSDGRVTLGLAYDVQGYNAAEDSRIISLARELNISPITLHYVGGPHGRAYAYKVRDWHDAGLLEGDVIFSHATGLEHVNADLREWDMLRESGASISTTPEDELGMGHGDPVIWEAIRRGVKVGLGIDCASIVSTEMFPAMRIALQWERGRKHKHMAKDDKGIAHNDIFAASAFRLATLGGAEAAHAEARVGSVEVGKLADIIIFDAESINLANCSDPFKGIVFHATAADIEHVLVNGEFVKREGKLVRQDWKEIAKELKFRSSIIKEKLKRFDVDERLKAIIPQLGF